MPHASYIMKQFELNSLDLDGVIGGMHREIALGLGPDHESSSLKMIPTYVFHLPKGNESGRFLAIDLGGRYVFMCFMW